MPYTPALATLGYIFSADGESVLMVHRTARADDPHFGKYNGLGGKLERDEDVVTGMRREIAEEAGIECDQLTLAGTISWPGFGKQGEDWFGFIFRITAWSGSVRSQSPEGPLVWVRIEDVPQLDLWPGDRLFLPLVLTWTGVPFHGVMPYQNGQPAGWVVSRC